MKYPEVGRSPDRLRGERCYRIWHQRSEPCEGCPVLRARESGRPCRAALGIGKALEEITQNRGTHYDSEVVRVCLKIFYDRKFEWEK